MNINFKVNNMVDEQKCPKCGSVNNYQDTNMWVCLECQNEWMAAESDVLEVDTEVKDVHGNLLTNGDSVTIVKDIKVKGSTSGIKAGTKVKNIILVEGHDGHNISCKVEGIGAMYLKSELVKKL